MTLFFTQFYFVLTNVQSNAFTAYYILHNPTTPVFEVPQAYCTCSF